MTNVLRCIKHEIACVQVAHSKHQISGEKREPVLLFLVKSEMYIPR